ncbi:MAG: corrinoid protein [Melioribacter sp.]|uniref:cobalamin B12-binding domain-containing protein n=1 Tax=Rosettibacter primus TaxID=3111523 RepID=UPI00247DF677|nr:corrinoid protein [Melioribacter sp.]
MEELINRITICIERGKVNLASPYPPDLRGQEGADELTIKALEAGLQPNDILNACNEGMKRIGDKFSRNEVFVPELLMAAKAMQAVMNHLKPYFQKGIVEKKGKFIIGTVAGDLHDIGKNLVSMVVEGNGYEVIDLGVDVKPNKFLDVIKQNPSSVVGLSALLTTTMQNMAITVKEIKEHFPDVKIIVGGAPLTEEAAEKMGADAYGPNPQSAVEFLESLKVN